MKSFLLRIHWAITRAYLRLRGAKVGKAVKCNGFPYVRIRHGGRLIIEDGVLINASRWANAHVCTGSTNLFVGPNATLIVRRGAGLSGARVVAMESIEIGPGSLIGSGCLICDSDMHEIPLGSDHLVRTAPIRIGSKVFIAAQALVLKGVEIGNGAVVGAGAVVSRSIPPNVFAAGNPARIRGVSP